MSIYGFFFWGGGGGLSDTFTCPILGPLVPLFWIFGDVSSEFQSQSGFCLIRIAEANVMYISWDPPLVLHIADLLTDSIAGHRPGSYLTQGYYCVAAWSLEPAINRSWVLCANHLATRPGHERICLKTSTQVFMKIYFVSKQWLPITGITMKNILGCQTKRYVCKQFT